MIYVSMYNNVFIYLQLWTTKLIINSVSIVAGNDFLSYLAEGEESVATRSDIPLADWYKMCLSRETLERLRLTSVFYMMFTTMTLYIAIMCIHLLLLYTVRSFVEMGRYLLNYPGVKFLLSERFTQDPLESFFGQQRQRGGRSDNPNVLQFIHTTSIRAHKAITPAVRGNVRGSRSHIGNEEELETPLPKRPRKQKYT